MRCGRVQCCLALRLASLDTLVPAHKSIWLSVTAESSLSMKRHPIAMSVDEMAVVEGRFSPAPISRPAPVGPVRRRSGSRNRRRSPRAGRRALHGQLHSCSFGPLRENSHARRTGLSWGQQHRRPSPHVLPGVLSVCLNHVLWNSKVPRLRNVVRAQAHRLSHTEKHLCIA